MQIVLAAPPKRPHYVILKPEDAATPQIIPRIIWSYWQQDDRPELIQLCINNWKALAPDHEIRVLSPKNFSEWLKPEIILDTFDSLPAYRQADWLRLQLLARHGGIWADASTILTENLDWLHTLQQSNQSEYTGFYINGVTHRSDQPIIENWFMAATPNSQFINDLIIEFNIPLTIGENSYLNELKSEGIYDDAVQGLDKQSQPYLIMHVASSAILFRNPKKYRLSLIRAEDSAFCYHKALRWRKRHLYIKLALTPCPKHLPALIKLRGSDRRVFDKKIAHGNFLKGSLLARYLYNFND